MWWPFKRKTVAPPVSAPEAPAPFEDVSVAHKEALDMMLAQLREQYTHVEIVNDTLVICPTWQDWRVLMRSRYLMENDQYVPQNAIKPFGRSH